MKYTLTRNGIITIVTVSIIVVLLLSIMAVSAYALSINKDVIPANTSISGIDVSGLSRQDALLKVQNAYQPALQKAFVTFRHEDRSWWMSYKDLGYNVDFESAVNSAFEKSHTGNFLSDLVDLLKAQYNSEDIPLVHSYDKKQLEDKLQFIAGQVNQAPVDAKITLNDKTFSVVPEKVGKKMDVTKAVADADNGLKKIESFEVELAIDTKQPAILKKDLDTIQDLLGEFSTKFNAADVDRTYNIKLATKGATNVLVKPGEILSLNKVFGPRLAEYGYKTAKVIVNNELVPGIGGGVCQVSSTLYNAVLLSNLKVVERRNHSLPLSYVPLGRDATIFGDVLDMKFQNNTPYPIYIYGQVYKGWVKFSVFGKKEYPNRTVTIATEIISKTEPKLETVQDPTLPEGTKVEEKKASPGYVVKTYRIVWEDKKVISKEFLSTSRYKVANGLTRIGTKKTGVTAAGAPATPTPTPGAPNINPGQ